MPRLRVRRIRGDWKPQDRYLLAEAQNFPERLKINWLSALGKKSPQLSYSRKYHTRVVEKCTRE